MKCTSMYPSHGLVGTPPPREGWSLGRSGGREGSPIQVTWGRQLGGGVGMSGGVAGGGVLHILPFGTMEDFAGPSVGITLNSGRSREASRWVQRAFRQERI